MRMHEKDKICGTFSTFASQMRASPVGLLADTRKWRKWCVYDNDWVCMMTESEYFGDKTPFEYACTDWERKN